MRRSLHYRVALSAAALLLPGNLAWSGCADPSSTEGAAHGVDYFGEEPPGLEARLFAGGELITDTLGEKNSFNLAFSPDGQEMFFSYYKGTEERPHPEYEIKTFKKRGDRWVGPTTAAFSGEYSDVDITFSPDGQTIFFASDRPNPESAELDIYYATRENAGWSEPIYAGPEVNSMDGEVYPSISNNGNLFFRSGRPDGYGWADLYRAEWIDGQFVNVRNLGPQVNTESHESNSVIAGDESFILFVTNRPAHEGIYHIYVSFQVGDNVWTQAVGLGPEVNSDAGAGAPTLSPDGRYLFFKKRQGPERGLYWISTEIIQQIRERVLGPPVPQLNEASFKQITFNSADEYYPTWAPDGNSIAYDGEDGIWTVSLEGGEPRQIVLEAGHPDWSPDGVYIAYDTNNRIRIISVRGGTPISAVPPAPAISRGGYPKWSPNGSRIAFAAADGSIWAVDLPTGDLERLFFREGYRARPFSWSPNGARLAIDLTNLEGETNTDVWLISLDAGPAVRLTDFPGREANPQWSPDGSLIAFMAEHSGNRDLWIVPIKGGSPIQLTKHPGVDMNPRWSPDGTKLAFSSDRSGNWDIWIVDFIR